MKKTKQGFTLIELLVALTILAILSTIGLVTYIGIQARARDSVRITNLDSLYQAISVAMQEDSSANLLCGGNAPPCNSDSLNGTRANNGNGWVKVNLSSQSISMPILPVDPTNTGTLIYTYNSDGTNWEIDAVLESDQYSSRMQNDGGNNDNKYEVGSNLTVVN